MIAAPHVFLPPGLMRYVLLLAAMLWSLGAQALTIDTPLNDPAQEKRARDLFYSIRCVVCTSESIAESQSKVAEDMRREVRSRIKAGQSNTEITDFLVSRYGDAVLMQPPLAQGTIMLWFGPLIVFVVGGLLAAAYFRAASRRTPRRPS